MNYELYLLWSPQGWGVFNEGTCPDPHGFPNYWYKKYEIPVEKLEIARKKLMEQQRKLVEDKTLPTRDNYLSIFPDLSDILD